MRASSTGSCPGAGWSASCWRTWFRPKIFYPCATHTGHTLNKFPRRCIDGVGDIVELLTQGL
eukprot:8083062-Prorocentrum_lima.AAC.1